MGGLSVISNQMMLAGLAFLGSSSLVLLFFMVLGRRKSRLDVRLAELSEKPKSNNSQSGFAQFASRTLPTVAAPLMPKTEAERTKLQTRLIYAGYYSHQALYIFFGIKMLLSMGPFVIGLLAGLVGLVPFLTGILAGACVSIIGMIAPSFYLDRKKKKRQTVLRRSLPDGLDLLVICLEGGLSLPGGLRRVAAELRMAHPQLASELNICQREIQLGWSSGDSLRRLSDRCDLEEVRGLAAVIAQSERYGASLVNALRVHAESLRQKRMQRAEEMAQKAAVKILFPTLFFIFPGMFIVILGPAVIQIVELMSKLKA